MGELPDFELTYREEITRRQTQQVATATVFAYKVGRPICTTATVVIQFPNHLLVANVGDSRAVLSM